MKVDVGVSKNATHFLNIRGGGGDNNNGNTWQLFNVNLYQIIAYFMLETGKWSLKQVFCLLQKNVYFLFYGLLMLEAF